MLCSITSNGSKKLWNRKSGISTHIVHRTNIIKKLQYANNAKRNERGRGNNCASERRIQNKPPFVDHERTCVYIYTWKYQLWPTPEQGISRSIWTLNSTMYAVGFGCQAQTHAHEHRTHYKHLVYNARQCKKEYKRNMTSDMHVLEAAQYAASCACVLYFSGYFCYENYICCSAMIRNMECIIMTVK